MIWVIAAAASQQAPPIPSRGQWLTPDDTPVELLRSNRPYFVDMKITVTPSGMVQACDVEGSSGVSKLDALTCKLVSKRARFNPARGSDGMPQFGVYRATMKWWTGDDESTINVGKRTHPFTLALNAAPPGIELPSSIRIQFAVDQNGVVSDCADEPHSWPGVEDPHPQLLVSLACEQVLKTFRPGPVKDASGTPVSSIQDLQVTFGLAAE